MGKIYMNIYPDLQYLKGVQQIFSLRRLIKDKLVKTVVLTVFTVEKSLAGIYRILRP
jgi:hypothetical protein